MEKFRKELIRAGYKSDQIDNDEESMTFHLKPVCEKSLLEEALPDKELVVNFEGETKYEPSSPGAVVGKTKIVNPLTQLFGDQSAPAQALRQVDEPNGNAEKPNTALRLKRSLLSRGRNARIYRM